jgi:hypothetical protein
MALQTGEWIWKLERTYRVPEKFRGDIGIGDLSKIAKAEVAVGRNLQEILGSYDIEFPDGLWRGARLIANGVMLEERNPAIARAQISRGLAEYDEERSVLLAEHETKFNELLARGDTEAAKNYLMNIVPSGPEGVPFPEELTSKNTPDPSSEIRLAGMINSALELKDSLSSATDVGAQLASARIEIEELQSQSEKIRDTYDRKIAQIEDSFREKLALSEPISFWSGRVRTHRIAKWIWFALLVAALSGFVVAGVEIVKSSWASLLTLEASSLPILALLLGVPTAVILWAIRIVARIYRNEAAMYDDALERQTMLQTYIAMLAGGDMHVEDRDHVLRAVFRPRTIDSMDDGGASPIAQVVQAFRDDSRKERS